ncbi:PEP-CTERM sorting domain-containing protein [Chitinolyticbacter albus]|uniref:PEP-CTERM sorting domain-containing protein n=1 Tax=Chitinolyticbacter albus TaxID=2961951 RepID=UPI00210C5183|nr:PEP-CTERM sorting domain-containing protein [Chitinolyticbacter albus]
MATLLAATTFTVALPAFAGMDDSWDWADDPATKKPKRKLTVFYDFDADKATLGDKKMKEVMDEAIDNWNKVKDDTGWEFVKGGTKDAHDLRIKVENIPRLTGGAMGDPSGIGKDRRLSQATITFDPAPREGFKWGVNDDKKVNPVRVAMHELTHPMRLAHQGELGTKSGKIKDPSDAVTAGDDVVTPSKDDKDEAKKISTAPINIKRAPPGGGGNVSLVVPAYPLELPVPVKTPNAELSIPGSALLNNIETTFSITSMYSMPSPFSTPAGVGRMIKGVHIGLTGLSGVPEIDPEGYFTVRIPYEDGVEGDGFLIELADPQFPRVDESLLRPFFFDSLSSTWRQVNPAALGGAYSLDTFNDIAQITLPTGMLGAFADPSDPLTRTLFISIAPVPEPSTMALLAVGLGVIGGIGRNRRRRQSA